MQSPFLTSPRAKSREGRGSVVEEPMACVSDDGRPAGGGFLGDEGLLSLPPPPPLHVESSEIPRKDQRAGVGLSEAG